MRERRARGVVMAAPVEIGEGGIEILLGNGLLKQHQTRALKTVGKACLRALQPMGRGGRGATRIVNQG